MVGITRKKVIQIYKWPCFLQTICWNDTCFSDLFQTPTLKVLCCLRDETLWHRALVCTIVLGTELLLYDTAWQPWHRKTSPAVELVSSCVLWETNDGVKHSETRGQRHDLQAGLPGQFLQGLCRFDPAAPKKRSCPSACRRQLWKQPADNPLKRSTYFAAKASAWSVPKHKLWVILSKSQRACSIFCLPGPL